MFSSELQQQQQRFASSPRLSGACAVTPNAAKRPPWRCRPLCLEELYKNPNAVVSVEFGRNSRKTMIYALVARGTPPVVLAEYTETEFSGDFSSIAYQCLQKLPASNYEFTYNCDNHTFNYLVHDGFTYCVVAEESAGRQLPKAFLERVKDDFVAKYGGGKAAATAPANGLNKEFGPKLKEHMQYCIEHPDEISKLAKVNARISEVKGVMMENIEKVLDRGEKIKLFMDKSDTDKTLHNLAQDFRSTGIQMRRKMWLQNMKIKLIISAIIIAIILIIVLSACKGFNCGK